MVQGRFCQHCGQENVDPALTVKSLFQHFLYDVTHFDGKYFLTVKKLFTRPGFLSREFIRGSRAGYLDPARMYIFTSAVFFLLFYQFFSHITEKDIRRSYVTSQELTSRLLKLDSSADLNVNLNEKIVIRNGRDTILRFADEAVVKHIIDSLDRLLKERGISASSGPDNSIEIFSAAYNSREAYDSAQQMLPAKDRDSWFGRIATYRQIAITRKYQGDRGAYFADRINRFIHSYPTIMFISLPLLALVLRLVYWKRKSINLAHHGIFLVHLMIFIFLVLIIYFSFQKLELSLHWRWISWLRYASVIWIFIYTFQAMRMFYQQSRVKTWLHYIPFLIGASVVILLVFGIYFTFVLLNE